MDDGYDTRERRAREESEREDKNYNLIAICLPFIITLFSLFNPGILFLEKISWKNLKKYSNFFLLELN